ncbi:MAG: TIGR03749 family integrating conjugative element protein [Steroidobacteraceae bacterium]
MKQLRLWILTVLVMTPLHAWCAGENSETLVWNRAPLRIALPVGSERRVDFPVEVDVFVPESLASNVVVTPTPEGSVFWSAQSAFETERLVVTDKSGRTQWLLDLSAKDGAPMHPLSIRDSRVANSLPPTSAEDATHDTVSDLASAVDEVDLVRAVARQFYGPARLAELPAGVSRASAATGSMDLYRGANLDTAVLGTWRAASFDGDLYVTAVQVVNRSAHEVRPDPRRLRARLLAMAAQHAWLAPAGQYPHDTTLWYLVTDRPLQESL